MTLLARPQQADDVAEILITSEQIAAKVRELGARIAVDYQGKDLVLVSILKGALPFLADLMRAQRPESVRLCVLLDKPARRVIPIDIDYRGFEIPDKFVVGYGLDYAERYRNLPFVGVLKPEVYARGS